MNLEILRFIIGTIVLTIGLLTFALEVFGTYRYEFVLNRMHAAALGSPVSSHLISRLEVMTDETLPEHCELDYLKEEEREEA